MELPHMSTPEPAHASTPSAGTPARLGDADEQAPPAEAMVPVTSGSDWDHVANGEAEVTLGED